MDNNFHNLLKELETDIQESNFWKNQPVNKSTEQNSSNPGKIATIGNYITKLAKLYLN